MSSCSSVVSLYTSSIACATNLESFFQKGIDSDTEGVYNGRIASDMKGGAHMKYPMVQAYATLKGVTLDSVAEKLNITRRTLYNKINGRSEFSLDESRKICEILGYSADQIFLTTDVSQTIRNSESA